MTRSGADAGTGACTGGALAACWSFAGDALTAAVWVLLERRIHRMNARTTTRAAIPRMLQGISRSDFVANLLGEERSSLSRESCGSGGSSTCTGGCDFTEDLLGPIKLGPTLLGSIRLRCNGSGSTRLGSTRRRPSGAGPAAGAAGPAR